jgi:site-specific DNA-methyltransferase (adenine-specific)
MSKDLLGSLELNRVYQFDCVEGMRMLIPDNSVDLTVTSPPYDNLRNYNGYSFDFENVAKELYRITKDGGVLVWVVGDETKDFCESMSSFKQAMYFREIGFKLLDTMIYYKENYAPAYPTLRRYANQFEFMFVLVKGKKPKTFNPVQREKTQISKGKSTYRQKDGLLKEKIISDNGRKTKDASNVWSFCVSNNKIDHPAVFPEALAQDHILSWSNEGDIVFDPFMGSGTTAKMAQINKRKYLGFEVSSEYIEIINKRLESIQEDVCPNCEKYGMNGCCGCDGKGHL